ncbi:MAG: ribonuclease PH [Deltaproteobacteria bacterium]|nr:ribonuclease PH [Deltaproteobacteria bacterium]
MAARSFNRSAAEMRPVSIEIGIQKFSLGSVLVSFGDTRVICAANIEEKVPGWMTGRGQGWLTAEYSMLPGSGQQRTQRDAGKGTNGRSQEIQRLIGRALRGVTDLKALGERTLSIDCDVLQADGGTRTASITGAYVAAALACKKLIAKGTMKALPFREAVAALSVGVIRGQVLVDLDYSEDSSAETDMNLVGTASGKLIEVQGTAEGAPFSTDELAQMVKAGQAAMANLFAAQVKAITG